MSKKLDEFVRIHLWAVLRPIIDDKVIRGTIRAMMQLAQEEKNLRGLLMSECGTDDLEKVSGEDLLRLLRIVHGVANLAGESAENVVDLGRWQRK